MILTPLRLRYRVLGYTLLTVPLILSACRAPGHKTTHAVSDGSTPPSTSVVPSEEEPTMSMAPSMRPEIRVDTSLGSFTLTLDALAAPITVANFVDYAESGFYHGLIFHRVNGMMIQGGAFTTTLDRRTKGLRDSIFNEWDNGRSNLRYTIGMVRRPGVLDSAQSEFYINLVDHPALDRTEDGTGYCVFGEVTDGFETLERIKTTPVAGHPKYAEGRSAVVPRTPVIIKEMKVVVPLDRAAASAEAARQKDIRQNRVAHFVKKIEAEAGRKAVRSDTGLIYIDMTIGDGGIPVEDSNVEVYYRGYYINEDEFESEMEKPVLLQLPKLTKGMQEGLLTMAEGGFRVLIIPPELAYGSGGIPGKIAPDSTLVFEVRLLEIK